MPHKTMRVVLLLVVLLMALAPSQADAGLLWCRSDPIVVLSDGTILDISVDVSTLAWNVREVHYVLHGPVGTSLVLALPTPTWLTSRETFQYIADQPAGQFTASYYVRTSKGNADVVGNMLIISVTGLHLGAGSVPGKEGTTLTLTLGT